MKKCIYRKKKTHIRGSLSLLWTPWNPLYSAAVGVGSGHHRPCLHNLNLWNLSSRQPLTKPQENFSNQSFSGALPAPLGLKLFSCQSQQNLTRYFTGAIYVLNLVKCRARAVMLHYLFIVERSFWVVMRFKGIRMVHA